MRSENELAGDVVGVAVQAGSVSGGITVTTGASTSVELLVKAVDHICSRHAVVRAVAMFELEQLAHEHAGLRPAVCDVLAVYLDLPREPTVAERRVRAVAQAVLGRVERLAVPPGRT